MSHNLDKPNIFWTYMLFLLWPILAVAQSCKNLDKKYAVLIVTMFFGLFGLTMIFSATTDAARYESSFVNVAQKPFSDFFNIVSGLYSDEGVKPDFVMDLITFIVSRFTTNAHIFFMVLGLVFGWMVTKNLSLFYKIYLSNRNIIGLMFLIMMAVNLSPGRILSFRHYLALAIFVYGIYKYFTSEEYIYLVVIAMTVFVHFAYLMIVPLFFLYKYIGNRNKLFYLLIVLSFLFSDQVSGLIRTYGGDLDNSLSNVVNGYTNAKYLDRVSGYQENRNVVLNGYMRWTTLFFLVAIVFHKIKYKIFDPVSERLYSFALVLFIFVNFTTGMESISNRFSIVFQVFVCIFFIHLYSLRDFKIYTPFRNVTFVFLAINLIIMLRLTIEYLNLVTITPFLPISLFFNSDATVLDMIK